MGFNVTNSNKKNDLELTERKQVSLNQFKDAIELMFFDLRDFISDPDIFIDLHHFVSAHHRVLHFVGCNPGLNIAELLTILQVTKQSLARVLRELIDGGYIQQQIGEHDRRKRLVHLTAKGHRLHNELIKPQIERFAMAAMSVDATQFEAWKNVMKEIISPQNREEVDKLIASALKEKTVLSGVNSVHTNGDGEH